jgi:hypothetical protein
MVRDTGSSATISVGRVSGTHGTIETVPRITEHEATIVIASGSILAGSLPARALRLVRERLEVHRDELAANFELASELRPLQQIAPLP